jgi:signal transduction histidine kinase
MPQTIRRFLYLLSALSLLIALLWKVDDKHLGQQGEADFDQFLKKEKAHLKASIDELIKTYQADQLEEKAVIWHSRFKVDGLSFFILSDTSVFYWSEDETATELSDLQSDAELLVTGTSLHLKHKVQFEGHTFVALERIASNYPYQNPYLPNQIEKEWLPFQEQLNNLLNEDQKQLNWSTQSSLSSDLWIWKLLRTLLFIVGVWGIILAFFSFFNLGKRSKAGLIILITLALRLLFFYFDPLNWDHMILFNPSAFSLSAFFPSTGDLFLHSLLLLIVSYQIGIILEDFRNKGIFFASLIIYIVGSYFGMSLIAEVIINSQYSFELENIFKLSLPSYLSLLSFGLIFMSILIWIKIMIRNASCFEKSWQAYFIFFLAYGSLFIIGSQDDRQITEAFLLIPALAFIYLISIRYKQKSDLLYPFLSLLLISLLCNAMIDRLVLEKEASNRELILLKLAEERDPLLEYLFQEIQVQIRSDDSLRSFIDNRWDERGAYQDYLRSKYFNGYWDRYRLSFTLCSDTDSLMVGPNQFNQNCFIFFQDRIYIEGDQISSINLFQLSNMAGRIDYIGEIELAGEGNYRLYLELSRDYFSEELGYPELFLNEEDLLLHRKLDEYSNAVYYRGDLINSSGDRIYTIHPMMENVSDSALYTYTDGNYENTALRKNENITIVLSQEKVSGVDYMSRITYLLILFGLLFLLLSFGLNSFPYAQRLIITDFSTKIRLLVSASLLTALILFLAGTTYYIKQQYEEKNARAMEEKLRSVSLELYQKVSNKELLAETDKAFMTNLLIKFSNVFYTDINLYDQNGKLYASSRPELYQQDLKSGRMNPIAYTQLAKSNKSKWVQGESIGELSFLSAYIPFKNQNNELLAYLNLPYFARQEALEEEIAAFLVPTINIYVIIFTFSLLISFVLISQISKPLLMIRRHISGLKLGGETELIDWQSEDEIGELVQEYNRIAIELGQSAEELAKRERESAWKEMAKQIAHEIKNPLTPMKLSVQHLQRSAESKDEDLQAKIKKTSDTLISQIESLTVIAEAFSSFAKFPDKDLKPLLLYPIANEVAHLYVDQAEVHFEVDQMVKEIEVLADRDLVLRVLNNLIKNSVQAYEDEGKAEIWIRIFKEEDSKGMLIVEVEDRGKGISQEQAAHIFEPSFTTKSSGTGMGLAIVKRSMEQMGGRVEMRSKVGEGSSFTLYFPIS